MTDDLLRRLDYIDHQTAREAAARIRELEAQLAAPIPQDSAWQPQPVAVRVKPLVWFEAELPSRGGGKYTAEGYTIRRIEGLWLLDFAGESKSSWRFSDMAAAKAAAQADYEARILSAIEAVPAATVRDETLEEAAMKLDAMARTKTYTDEDLGETTGRNLINPISASAAIRAMKGGAK